jgi:hypothetical protein
VRPVAHRPRVAPFVARFAGRLEYESLAGNVVSLRVRANAVMYADTLAGGLEGQLEGAVDARVCP